MDYKIKRYIHAFRNALELGANSRSHECFHMGRWNKELNSFPYGCCDLASNFLAKYLKECDKSLEPKIIVMDASQTFREQENSSICGHVMVQLDDFKIDITLNQFKEYSERVIISNHCGILSNLVRNIERYGGKVIERDIDIDSASEDGSDLYQWVKKTADQLLIN
ncbi:TPA: hypothetical protein ACQVHG_000024 [Serratia marcescens]|uniref:hypothetical protein n=1 Tax=Serratia marcescens TaxID=615 RepID=UPI0013CED2E3|nr:hypothetical protein [Serratia marcescens]